MQNYLILAAFLLPLAAAQAGAAEYTFYTSSGAAYCDGVRFTNTVPAVGYHVFDQATCPGKPDYLGGFKTPLRDLGPGNWYTFPVSNRRDDAEGESVVDTFYINVGSMSWVLAQESADLHYPFNVLMRGVLVKGAPGEQPAAPKLLISTQAAARAKVRDAH